MSDIPLSGLVGWFRADDLTLDDDDPVAMWPDASGQGNDAAQATQANQPTFKAGILNGLPVVRFDRTNATRMATGNISGVRTVITVTIPRGHADFTRIYGWREINAYSIFGRADGTFEGRYNSSTSQIMFGEQPVGEPILLSTVFDGSTFTGWTNGTLSGSGAGTPNDTAGAFVLSDRADNTGAQVLQGDIAEVVIYDRALNTEERQQVEAYLDSKWVNPPAEPQPSQGCRDNRLLMLRRRA